MTAQSILVVEDDSGYRELLELTLREEGYEVATVTNHTEALNACKQDDYDLVICDFRLPGQNGLDLLKELKKRAPNTGFILLTALGKSDQAAQTIKDGADNYLVKGSLTPDTLATAVRKALERRQMWKDNQHMQRSSHFVHNGNVQETASAEIGGKSPHSQFDFEALSGHSPAMADLRERIKRVAPYRSPILITGESGTGKELVARSIHQHSSFKDGSFVSVDVASLPGTLLDSELFGYVKDAFPGADQNMKGQIEEAENGTIYFHDIAELPHPLQAKLLRLIQHQKLRRLGDSQEINANTRVICATTKDLWALTREGAFREDLLYGINVIHLHVPPLRERPEDIPTLVDHILLKLQKTQRIQSKSLSPETMKPLMDYQWPRNIRELETILERSAILAEGPVVTPDHLPDELKPSPKGITFHIPSDLIYLKDVIRELTEKAEKELITRALSQTNNNRTRAAKLLGISHRSLLYKLKDYHIR
jgi:two-component system response regulator AtoC